MADEELEQKEHRKAEERAAVSASVLHEAVLKEGEEELDRPPSALAWSGLAAGLSMGLSLLAEGALHHHLPEARWSPLVSKLGYPIGFLAEIVGRQQLFTENTLTPLLPLFTGRATASRVARLWAIVFVANLVGAAAFAALAAWSGAMPADVLQSLAAVAQDGTRGSFAVLLAEGVFAGWLVALLVWMQAGTTEPHVGVIVALTYLIGIGGFAHVIAGAAEVFFLVFRGAASLADALRFLSAVLLGNVLGGVSLVALVNHRQATSGADA